MKKVALVFLHGFCEDATMWDDFISPFKEEYEPFALNLPGFGGKEPIKGGLDNWAKSLLDELDQLEVKEFVLIGHSLGSYVGLAMLAQQKHRFLGFVFFHSTPLADNEEKKQNRLKQIEFIQNHGSLPLVKQLIPALFHPECDQEKVSTILKIAERQKAEGIVSALLAMRERPDRSQLLLDTPIPFLFISGKHDTLISWEQQLEMTKKLPNATFVLLEKSAHMGFIEEPETSREKLLLHLKIMVMK